MDDTAPNKDQDTRNLVDKYKGMRVDEIKQSIAFNAFPYHIAIENIQHDFNIGSIVRNANAFAASGVHIIGKKHWNRRGAMATEKYLPLYHHRTSQDLTHWCNGQSLPIIGIDNVQTSIPLRDATLPASAVYVFGQEGPGLSPELQAICQQIIGIEQYGSTRSVNVGVASGIFMFEYTRRLKHTSAK